MDILSCNAPSVSSGGQRDGHRSDRPRGGVRCTAVDELPGALGHRDSRTGDVEDQSAAVADELRAERGDPLLVLAAGGQHRREAGESFPGGEHEQRVASFGTQLICNGRALIFHITRARVSMPKSTREFIDRCATYAATGTVTTVPIPLPA